MICDAHTLDLIFLAEGRSRHSP